MICPNCQSRLVVTTDSRIVYGERQRRRECRECRARWFTHEAIVEGSLKLEPAWWSLARALEFDGLTQTEIAKKLGKTQGMVCRALKPAVRARINAGKTYDSEVHNIKRRARQEARA